MNVIIEQIPVVSPITVARTSDVMLIGMMTD